MAFRQIWGIQSQLQRTETSWYATAQTYVAHYTCSGIAPRFNEFPWIDNMMALFFFAAKLPQPQSVIQSCFGTVQVPAS